MAIKSTIIADEKHRENTIHSPYKTMSKEELNTILSSNVVSSWLGEIRNFIRIHPAFLAHPKILNVHAKKYKVPQKMNDFAQKVANTILEKNPNHKLAQKVVSYGEIRSLSEFRVINITLLLGSRILTIPNKAFNHEDRYLISVSGKAVATLKKGKLLASSELEEEMLKYYNEDEDNDADDDIFSISEQDSAEAIDDTNDIVDDAGVNILFKDSHITENGAIRIYKMPPISLRRYKLWRQRRKAAKNMKK